MSETFSGPEFRFDIFGRHVAVNRISGRWQVDYLSSEGKRRPVIDILIPAFVTADELPQYLFDVCHEWADEAHPDVRPLP